MSKECGILFDIRERSVGRCLPITFNSSRADGEGRGRTDQKKKKTNKASVFVVVRWRPVLIDIIPGQFFPP